MPGSYRCSEEEEEWRGSSGVAGNELCQNMKHSESVVATQIPTKHGTASVSILRRKCA